MSIHRLHKWVRVSSMDPLFVSCTDALSDTLASVLVCTEVVPCPRTACQVGILYSEQRENVTITLL